MSRVRRVENRQEMERSIDEFITRGYRLKSQGERSAKLKDRDWGEAEVHVIIALLSAWWTFGLSNVLYALYRYVNADEVLIKVEDDRDDA